MSNQVTKRQDQGNRVSAEALELARQQYRNDALRQVSIAEEYHERGDREALARIIHVAQCRARAAGDRWIHCHATQDQDGMDLAHSRADYWRRVAHRCRRMYRALGGE